MIDKLLFILHPSVKKEWESFYPENIMAISRFLCHSNDIPSFRNPVDRRFRYDNTLNLIPKKLYHTKVKDLLPIAPYRLIKYVLENKTFILEANRREERYKQVIKLLDECPYGVTSVCSKHMHFRLTGGKKLPKDDRNFNYLNAVDELNFMFGLGRISDREIFGGYEEKSKRDHRTREDVTSVKNAHVVSYEDLDILFEDLYPYCDEIKTEEKRVVEKLHEEDIKEKFKAEIIDNERRSQYYVAFLKKENHEKDTDIQKKEYCIQHIRLLDSFISKKLEEEADAIADQWPLGYEWYEQTNSDPDIGDMLEGDDFLFDCIKHKDIIEKKQETLVCYNELLSKYPEGIKAYIDAHKTFDDNLCRTFVPAHEDIIKLGKDKLKEYQENAKKMAFHSHWLQSQTDYSKFSKEIMGNTDLASWGAYRYFIPFKTIAYDGKEVSKDYPVWQLFPQSYCLDETLDYSNNKSQLEKAKNLIGFRNKIRYFKTNVYDMLLSYIKEIYSKYGDELVVLFGTSGITDYEAFNVFHFAYLKQQLTNQKIPFKEIGKDPRSITDKARYVIVEVITDNSQMKETCQRVLGLKHTCHLTCTKPVSQECFSDIVYISLNKELSSAEMRKVINNTKQKIAKQKELEQKQREEERKRQEEEQRRKNEQLQIKSNLISAVSSWNTLIGGLHYSYQFYYYPTTCEFEATEEEWYYRRLVWDFKNTPGKTSSIAHKIALDKAVSMIKTQLMSTFDEKSRKYLTLVCIPASSQVKTQARYEEFSNRICNELGMINAYPHITVVAEKEEKHLGGSGLDTSKLHFDEGYFKGKYVLLFDDIITKGNSMITFKRKMEALGAIVIGGLSLGKTKHERPVVVTETPRIFSHPPFPPQPTYDNSDDLPF